MNDRITLGDAIQNIEKDYRCNYCQELLDTHEEAVTHMIHNHVTEHNITL